MKINQVSPSIHIPEAKKAASGICFFEVTLTKDN